MRQQTQLGAGQGLDGRHRHRLEKLLDAAGTLTVGWPELVRIVTAADGC